MKMHSPMFVLCFAVGLGCTRGPSRESYSIDRFEFRLENVTESLRGARVAPAFFGNAQSAPWVGRVFVPEEYQPDRNQVVVLAFSVWQRRLGGDPALVGRTVQLNGRDFQVVGIMPKSFAVPAGVELWVPESRSNR
jgi:hypothetical protein